MYLKYITDEKLIEEVKKILAVIEKAKSNDIYSNALDPFSFIFDVTANGLTVEEWFEQEEVRQAQKSMQNQIGNFHQGIVGNSIGWSDLGIGKVIDLKCDSKKILAEIKNKHNTTKGNHKINVYDDLEIILNMPEYKDYTGYYVEVIPANKNVYNKPFQPPDNKIKDKEKKNRPMNEKIRQIDGKSFYSMVGGYENALKDLYLVIPKIVSELTGKPLSEKDVSKYLEILNSSYNFR
ncbi:MAG: Eco47II family restriction endonuclease [Candidatus Gracilibacteria bacterium]|nr:Eco47II family restriction endonuclease [Candidatus Gracilibacteria bacterium]